MTSRNLIFLLSLPRSGSTWVQRNIMKRKNVKTLPETWLFLSLASAFKPSSMLTEYNALLQNKAFLELEQRAVDKKIILNQVLKSVAEEICEQLNLEKKEFFLEKTPRNLLILDDLIEAFPSATFINLFRDPADIMISMAQTWGGGYTTLFRYEVDFKVGLPAMLKNASHPNAINIYYEDLLINDDRLNNVLDFLGNPNNLRSADDIYEATKSSFIGDQKYKKKNINLNKSTWYTKYRMKKMLREIPETFWINTKYDKLNSYQKIKDCKPYFRPVRDVISIIVELLYRANLHGIIFLFHKDRVRNLGKFRFTLE